MKNMNYCGKIIALILFAAFFGCTQQNQKDPFEKFKEGILSYKPSVSKVSDVAMLIEKSEAEYVSDPEIFPLTVASALPV
ncbi:hypothetical protein ES708_31343 [subsurface metagenome]